MSLERHQRLQRYLEILQEITVCRRLQPTVLLKERGHRGPVPCKEESVLVFRRLRPSGFTHVVLWVVTSVSDEHIASIFRVETFAVVRVLNHYRNAEYCDVKDTGSITGSCNGHVKFSPARTA